MPLPSIATPTYELVIPSTGETVSYRPFLVKEEKVLLMALEGEDRKAIIKSLQDIIKACILSENFDVSKLAMFDIEYVFLQLRARSIGEVIEPTILCKPCDQPVTLEIDVSKVMLTFDDKHTPSIALTDTIGLNMRYPTISSVPDANFTVSEDQKPTASDTFDTIISCIDSIYDGEQTYQASDQTKQELLTFVENLTQAQFQKIQNFFETMPKLEHSVTYTNPCTKEEEVFTLSSLQDFFV